MSTVKLFSVLFILLTLPVFTIAQSTTKSMDLLSAAEKFDSDFLTAFNSGDLDALMQLYWNDPALVAYGPTGSPIFGYANFKEVMKKEFAAYPGAILNYTNVNNLVAGDIVIGHGQFDWILPVSPDSTMTMQGRYTEVKAIKNGKMVIILDHVSLPMPTE